MKLENKELHKELERIKHEYQRTDNSNIKQAKNIDQCKPMKIEYLINKNVNMFISGITF
jgi:hypothetical protein